MSFKWVLEDHWVGDLAGLVRDVDYGGKAFDKLTKAHGENLAANKSIPAGSSLILFGHTDELPDKLRRHADRLISAANKQCLFIGQEAGIVERRKIGSVLAASLVGWAAVPVMIAKNPQLNLDADTLKNGYKVLGTNIADNFEALTRSWMAVQVCAQGAAAGRAPKGAVTLEQHEVNLKTLSAWLYARRT